MVMFFWDRSTRLRFSGEFRCLEISGIPRSMKTYSVILVAITFLTCFLNGEEVVRKLDDFDEPFPLESRWLTVGDARMARVDAPVKADMQGVSYKMLKVEGGAGSVFAVRSSFLNPRYWKAETFRFRASAPGASVARPLVLAVEFYATERKAYFRRTVTLTSPDWSLVELPLRFIPVGLGNLEWRECHRFAFRFRSPGSLQIDAIELVETDRKHPTEVTAEEIGKLAFGDKIRADANARFSLFSDAANLDGKIALGELEKTYAGFSRDFPSLRPPARPLPVLVFAKVNDYGAFWKALAEQYGETAPVPGPSSHLLHGVVGAPVATTGKLPQKISSEIVRLLLATGYGLPADGGNWLSEGIVSHYEFSARDEDLHQLTKRALVAGKFLPLTRLLDGKPIPRGYAPQAALFVQYLLEHSSRREAFDRAIRYMVATGSLDFAPACQAKFGATLRLLENAWLKWCHKRAGLK